MKMIKTKLASLEQKIASTAPEAVIKDAAAAYLYLYPLVTFGVPMKC
jgi:hypothetical protein